MTRFPRARSDIEAMPAALGPVVALIGVVRGQGMAGLPGRQDDAERGGVGEIGDEPEAGRRQS